MPPIADWQFLLRVQPGHVAASAADSFWNVDGPTWITAIATVLLALFAVFTTIYAIRTFRDQAKGLTILKEQNNRDIAERHQAQAARVFTGVEDRRPRYSHPYAKNGSDFPVYDAQLWQAYPDGLSDPCDVGMIPPGSIGVDSRDISYEDAAENTVLTFRDAAGTRWIRMADGTIKEQERGTAHDSILAALGRPIPVPTEPAAAIEPTKAAEPSADAEENQAPDGQ